MPLKRLEDVQVGDVLAQDLTNAQGTVLVKANTPLQEAHIRLLRMWGVEKAHIAAPDSSEEESQSPDACLDAAEAEIKKRFGKSLDNEVMAQILRVAVIQHAAKLAGARKSNHG